jgi:orotidine-5'-phosphate decarboxylase
MDFLTKLKTSWNKNNSLLCIGLDPDMTKLPSHLREGEAPYFTFNRAIIDATAEVACAYKPNSAFYEARGSAGIQELQLTCAYIQEKYPDIPIILDFKRGDIGNTNKQYAAFAFEYLGVDAITVQPYQGQEASQSFLDYKEKGIIILCKTSNSGSGEFQDLEIDGKKLYAHVAERVKNNWNSNGNCLLVVGATYPSELADIRSIIGDEMVILVPGLGAQGGDTEATLKAGLNSVGDGLIIHTSRAVLYASDGEDFAEAAGQAALRVRNEINTHRQHKGASQ